MKNTLCLLLLATISQAVFAAQPNFVVIFADDLGYGDISCYGPTGVETPHLDALAAEGLRSTDLFSEDNCLMSSICSTRRLSIDGG